jgi:NADP-dependent aldehyde dehydrogenase
VNSAVEAAGMPAGVFSMLHSASHETSLGLVRHRAIKAVGFTGSLGGGRALFDAAAARPEPIPVYAEMGSTNPVFVLPGALKTNASAIADALVQSVTLGVGQFCTNPGLVFGCEDEGWKLLVERAGDAARNVAPGVMLLESIWEKYYEGAAYLQSIPAVAMAGRSAAEAGKGQAPALVLSTDAATFRRHERLGEEVFGPATVLVRCQSAGELESIARSLPGQLTATIHGTEEDLARHAGLVAILRHKAGRLLFNQFPTGVEVCASMQHGGPYPATSDSRSTSVGTAAIKRFVRPVCYQNFPDAALPEELKNSNPRKLWRLVDQQFTKDAV